MIALKKETYDYKEVAALLTIKQKHIKKLILAGKLTAIDIRINPNPKMFDIRFIRIPKGSIADFIRTRIVCNTLKDNKKESK